jgi:hypothetical protein
MGIPFVNPTVQPLNVGYSKAKERNQANALDFYPLFIRVASKVSKRHAYQDNAILVEAILSHLSPFSIKTNNLPYHIPLHTPSHPTTHLTLPKHLCRPS